MASDGTFYVWQVAGIAGRTALGHDSSKSTLHLVHMRTSYGLSHKTCNPKYYELCIQRIGAQSLPEKQTAS